MGVSTRIDLTYSDEAIKAWDPEKWAYTLGA
jgi:hypothetical protein